MSVRGPPSAEPVTLEPTGFHKFYSETRGDWASTHELEVGEIIRGRTGPLEVARAWPHPGTHRVYNLTVEGEHVYYVGEQGLLAHNNACTVRCFHGTDGDNILSILDEGALRPNGGKVFLSEVKDTFGHGGDLSRNKAFTIEVELKATTSDVIRTSVVGNPRTIQINTQDDVITNVKRLFIRTPKAGGGFTEDSIDGAGAIRAFLTKPN